MAVTAGRATKRPRSRSGGLRRRQAVTAYALLAPNLLVFAVFMFLPLVLTFVTSLQEKRAFGPAEWIGLENFSELLGDRRFWTSLVNTVGYAAVSVPLSLALGLGVAMLLNRSMWLRGIFRTVYYLPVVISGIAIGLLGFWMFDEQVGVINKMLEALGLSGVGWRSSTFWAWVSIVLSTLWFRVGFCMVIYLAALQNIPREYYDASATDGATPWQQFRLITLPLLRMATVVLALYGVIESFQVFDVIYVLTRGGPGDSTFVLGVFAYEEAFEQRQRGYGAAIGVVLYLLLMIVLVIQYGLTRRRGEED